MIDPIIPAACMSIWPSTKRLPRKPPTSEPIKPKTRVPTTPIESEPGTSARAMNPAISPMINQTIIPKFSSR